MPESPSEQHTCEHTLCPLVPAPNKVSRPVPDVQPVRKNVPYHRLLPEPETIGGVYLHRDAGPDICPAPSRDTGAARKPDLPPIAATVTTAIYATQAPLSPICLPTPPSRVEVAVISGPGAF